jgi:hypothetical protein
MPFLKGMPSCDLWGRNEGQLSLQINSWLGAFSFDKDFSPDKIIDQLKKQFYHCTDYKSGFLASLSIFAIQWLYCLFYTNHLTIQ